MNMQELQDKKEALDKAKAAEQKKLQALKIAKAKKIRAMKEQEAAKKAEAARQERRLATKIAMIKQWRWRRRIRLITWGLLTCGFVGLCVLFISSN